MGQVFPRKHTTREDNMKPYSHIWFRKALSRAGGAAF